jgi:hypothetical protein
MRQEVSPLSPLFTDDASAESNDGWRIMGGASRSRNDVRKTQFPGVHGW